MAWAHRGHGTDASKLRWGLVTMTRGQGTRLNRPGSRHDLFKLGQWQPIAGAPRVCKGRFYALLEQARGMNANRWRPEDLRWLKNRIARPVYERGYDVVKGDAARERNEALQSVR